MSSLDLDPLTNKQLIELWASVMSKLRERQIVRTFNNPTGDIAEALAADHLGLTVVDANSVKGHDAVDPQGLRYQVKARRVTSSNKSRQLGAIRDLHTNPFDVLVAVFFDEAMTMTEMWTMPPEVVSDYARFSSHTKAHLLRFAGDVLTDDRVQQVFP